MVSDFLGLLGNLDFSSKSGEPDRKVDLCYVERALYNQALRNNTNLMFSKKLQISMKTSGFRAAGIGVTRKTSRLCILS